MRRATFSQVCQWILIAWSSVKESTITNGFLKAGLLRDAGSTSDAEAPPKRRATLIPRAPALGCLHRTRISPRRSSCDSAPWSHIQLICQCVSWRDTLVASGENRLDAEMITSRSVPQRGAAWRRSVPQRARFTALGSLGAVRHFSVRCEPGVMRRTAQAQGRICLGRKVTLRAQTKERLSATSNSEAGTPAAYRQVRLIYVQFLFSFKN